MARLPVEIRQGDVYWSDFGPVTDSAPAGRRPCVVVQNDLLNRSGLHTTVVCGMTSNLARAEVSINVLLRKGEGGLPRASVVNVSQLTTVDKIELVEKLGRLSADRIDAIHAGISRLTERV